MIRRIRAHHDPRGHSPHTVPALSERDTVLTKPTSLEMMPEARPYSDLLARAMTCIG